MFIMFILFLSQGIPTFDELLPKSTYNFAKRIERTTNDIISLYIIPVYFILYFSFTFYRLYIYFTNV